MVEIEATKNPLDFNKAHQAEEIEKLGETFIGKKDELSEAEKVVGSGTAPKSKTEVELKKLLSKLEKQKDKIKKGKVYKTTNIDKVNYAISYIEARLLNYATKGEDLIITKKKKYGDELPKKAKPYKAKEVKPKEVKPEPKKEEPKPEPKKEEPKPKPKKEEPKKEEPKPKKEPQPWSQSGICKKIMCAYGLRNKAQYKAWILKNHPDKGGKISNEDLVKILECANSKMYCKGKKPVIVEPEPPEPLRLIYKEEPKIELPEPEPTKQKIEPLVNKLEDKIKEFEELGRKHGAVIYSGSSFIQVVAYIALLLEYEAKCAIVGKDGLNKYTVDSATLKSPINMELYNSAKELSEDLLDCIERGDELIAIPLRIWPQHANLLIYRPLKKTIERFEPHGARFRQGRDKDDERINNVLTRMFEVEMKPYLKEYTPKFISPDQICPNPRGFQKIEGEALNKLPQESGGYCGMWSLFLLELIFINPTKPTAEIIQEALKQSNYNPQYLRNVIRGYVLKVEKMLDSYIKKIDANDGFTFAKKNDFIGKKVAFQENLLNLLLSFGGKNSKIKVLQEELRKAGKPVIVEPKPSEPKKEEPKIEIPKPKPVEPKKEEPSSSKEHAKIKIPEPEPTKQKIEPLVNKLEDKIKEFEELGRKHGAVIYDAGNFIQVVAYISLIIQYEAKCAIVGDFKDFSNYEISSDLKSIKNDIFYSKAKEFSEDLLDCVKRGDNLIAIPLSLKLEKDNAGHANMLIYRPFDKTIERIEPYGQTIDSRKLYSKTYNAVLKRMFEEEMKPYLKEYTPKFIPSDQVCPSLRGFQSLESSLAGGTEEGIGFCGMWSLFMLELLFLNPTLPTSEIIKIALNISKNKPQYLKNVIRGYVLRVEKMLDSYIKNIGASDGFKFKTGKKITKKITLLQEQLLNLLLSFNSETSKVETLKETVKFNKQKDIDTSAIRKFLLSKTIDELTEMINTIFKIDLRNNKDVDAEEIIIWLINTYLYEDKFNLGTFKRFGSQYKDHYIDDIYNYYNVKKGGIFGWSDEEKEAKKAKQEAKRAEKKAKYDARKKEQNVKIGELIVSLKALKKKKQAQKEATEAPKAEAEPEAEPEAVTEPIEGGIFGWSDKEKADKAERKMLREEYYKTHNRQQNANYTFDKTARANWKREFYKKNTFKKADDTMPKAVDTNEQQGIDEAEQEMLGSGMYYLKEIIKPTNPIFKYKRTFEIPTFIDPETEFLMGGAFTDMLGMNCNKEDGSCFNPTWERRKIRSQILSEYKIWYNPFAPPPAGTIRMAWLNPMIEERFKPIYDEFVARRNVNIGLPADASRDRFAQQMFSNITDGLSYVPISNIASAGLTLASTLTDNKKEDGT